MYQQLVKAWWVSSSLLHTIGWASPAGAGVHFPDGSLPGLGADQVWSAGECSVLKGDLSKELLGLFHNRVMF